MSDNLLPVFLQFFVALLLAGVILGLSWFVGRRVSRRARTDLTAYECGLPPMDEARKRFSVKFYLIAMLFILFDIEVAFLFPWAAVFRHLGVAGFWQMALFLFVLLLGYLYILRRGALDWE